MNAALAMRASLDRFNRDRELPVPLRTHVGVNSGTVLAGHVGGEVKRELTVVGEVVDVADVLKDVAPNGTVWVGEETYQRTTDAFAYGPRQTPSHHGRTVVAWRQGGAMLDKDGKELWRYAGAQSGRAWARVATEPGRVATPR